MAESVPLPSEGVSGGEDSNRATATCYCGAVQIDVPTDSNLLETFVCNCADCRKVTASMFASNFIVRASDTKHIRGKDKLTKFAKSNTIASGNTMESYFCSVCGTLMYRISSGFPEFLVPRIGTIDDINLHGTKFKPRREIFTKSRVAWLDGAKGAEQHKEQVLKL